MPIFTRLINTKMKPLHKLVLLAMTAQCDAIGQCCIPQPQLARQCGVAPKVIRRVIAECIELGYLGEVPAPGGAPVECYLLMPEEATTA